MSPPLPESPPPSSESALWHLLLGLGAVGVMASGLVWWLVQSAGPDDPDPTRRPAAVTTSVRPPVARFTDVTPTSGVSFRHDNGARGEKWLPETMGGGVACFDADGDGDADLLFINSTWWPGDPRRASEPPPTSALYRNDTVPGGPLRFTDISGGSGLDVDFYGMGAACADFDNDGAVDVLMTGVGGSRLFHNLGGGRFREVTAESGVGGRPEDWSTAAAWFDADRDGDLDLYVGHYVGWSPEVDRRVNNQLPGVGRAYGRPWNFPGTVPRFYRNEGGQPGLVRFTDVSAASGLQVTNPATGLPAAKTLAVAPLDLNDDGWMDLVVANDTVQNFVFTNRHDGTFAEVGELTGMAFDAFGQARGAMGIDAARFRNDEAVAVAIGNFANEMNALYVARKNGRPDQLHFTDEAVAEGLGPASQSLLKFGLFFFDYDLDGRPDVLTANGHIEEAIEKIQPGARYRQPAQLFWNAGGAPAFLPVDAAAAGPDLFEPVVGRGSAYADLDGDGDLDVVIAQLGGAPRVLRNDQTLGHGSFRLKLVGTRANRDAIGTWITVRSGGRLQSRQVMPTRSYLSQSELPVTFGLGTGRSADEITIQWPGGPRQKLAPPPSGTVTTVTEAGR
ncbi:MAG: CRTAC1 family protein [Verrucomicrobia bacterium]|nr:CRTAC1 family protein [Verrucomicrobiota bacterium]